LQLIAFALFSPRPAANLNPQAGAVESVTPGKAGGMKGNEPLKAV